MLPRIRSGLTKEMTKMHNNAVLHDMNRSWIPPANFEFNSLKAEGAFLVALYVQNIYQTGTTEICGQNFVTVYLNDMGREVSRTEHRVDFAPTQKPYVPPVVPWRFHVRDGFLLMLEGFKEMTKCHKK